MSKYALPHCSLNLEGPERLSDSGPFVSRQVCDAGACNTGVVAACTNHRMPYVTGVARAMRIPATEVSQTVSKNQMPSHSYVRGIPAPLHLRSEGATLTDDVGLVALPTCLGCAEPGPLAAALQRSAHPGAGRTGLVSGPGSVAVNEGSKGGRCDGGFRSDPGLWAQVGWGRGGLHLQEAGPTGSPPVADVPRRSLGPGGSAVAAGFGECDAGRAGVDPRVRRTTPGRRSACGHAPSRQRILLEGAASSSGPVESPLLPQGAQPPLTSAPSGTLAAERPGRGGVLRRPEGLQRDRETLGLPALGPPGTAPDQEGRSHTQAGHLRGDRHGAHPHEPARHSCPPPSAALQCRSCGGAADRRAESTLRGPDGRRRPGPEPTRVGAGRRNVADAPSAPYHRSGSRPERRPDQADPVLAVPHARSVHHERWPTPVPRPRPGQVPRLGPAPCGTTPHSSGSPGGLTSPRGSVSSPQGLRPAARLRLGTLTIPSRTVENGLAPPARWPAKSHPSPGTKQYHLHRRSRPHCAGFRLNAPMRGSLVCRRSTQVRPATSIHGPKGRL